MEPGNASVSILPYSGVMCLTHRLTATLIVNDSPWLCSQYICSLYSKSATWRRTPIYYGTNAGPRVVKGPSVSQACQWNPTTEKLISRSTLTNSPMFLSSNLHLGLPQGCQQNCTSIYCVSHECYVFLKTQQAGLSSGKNRVSRGHAIPITSFWIQIFSLSLCTNLKRRLR